MAEKVILECCSRGEAAIIADTLPVSESPSNLVRAQFIRFLALGGDEAAPVHERGISVVGAWLVGELDLEGVDVACPLRLRSCRIERIEAGRSRLLSLDLNGSRLIGALAGDELRCDGSMLLRGGFVAEAGVRLMSALIAGSLECDGSQFRNDLGPALFLGRASIGGSLFLRHGFHAVGEVRLWGASIRGALDCRGGRFENPSGNALSCNNLVADRFVFIALEGLQGTVDLAGMRAGSLIDDSPSWMGAYGRLILDGFTYERLGGAAVDAPGRIAWLDGQIPEHLESDFKPQPWDQLIAALRANGSPDDARTVAIAKHRRMRRAGKYVADSRMLDWIYSGLLGYGYRPSRLLGAIMATWLLCGLAYWAAANPRWFGSGTHLIAPTEAKAGPACLASRAATRSTSRCPALAADYRDFAPFVYSTDVLLPVLNLGYREKWQPVVRDEAGNSLRWGALLRTLYWFEIAFGWLAGLQLIGMVGNLIKKD